LEDASMASRNLFTEEGRTRSARNWRGESSRRCRERTPIPAPANMTSNNQRSRLQFAFSEAARDRLARYEYPGNVRELQKIVSKAVGVSLSPLEA